MKRINSLNDLLIEELADLLNAENQLIEVLSKMVEASQSSGLKFVLDVHLEVTKGHVGRLQDIFDDIGQDPRGEMSRAMKGLIEEGQKVVTHTEKSAARDTAIISVAQQVEHYEIRSYMTAREHAVDLGNTRLVKLLDETLDEEMAMNLHLNELAQSIINVQATNPDKRSQKKCLN